MSWIAWIIVGFAAGMLAKWMMPDAKDEPNGFMGTALLGIVGAVIGGWMCRLFLNQTGPNGVNLFSILVALIGACIVIGMTRMFASSNTANYYN